MIRRPCDMSFNTLLATIAIIVSLALGSCGRMTNATLAPARVPASDTQGGGGTGGGGGGGAADEMIAGQVVVTLAPGTDPGVLASTYSATLIDYEADERTATFAPIAPQTDLALQTALLADPRVVTAEANLYLETAEARQQSFAFDDGAGASAGISEQPAVQAIRLNAAHEVATGKGVTIAILDTGIDRRHTMLRAAYAGGVDFVDDDNDPSEFANGLDDDSDGNIDEAYGHGTHVAGIVHVVAPEARLLAVRVLDADGRGDIQAIAAGVRWAVAHGAKVINLSLGSLTRADALQNALEEAEDKGVIVLASAGNWGSDTPVEFPARSTHVAAIAAVDANANPATFSSYGRIIALSAPGVGVRSTYPGNQYRLWSGTSMAAPFVAGTVALLAEMHPSWNLVQMMERISETVQPVVGDNGDFGAGALDAGAALTPDARSRIDDVPPAEDIRPGRR